MNNIAAIAGFALAAAQLFYLIKAVRLLETVARATKAREELAALLGEIKNA